MRLRKRLSRGTSLALLIVCVTASTALAHWIADSGYVWDGPDGKCLKARAEISDGRNQEGFSKADGWPKKRANTPAGGADCQVGYERPAGDIATKAILWKWHPNPREWYFCAQTAWAYNQETASHVEKRKYWDDICGNGTYQTSAPTYTQFNGDWKGGSMWAGGGHFLYEGGTDVTGVVPGTQPSYVNLDGTQNPSTSPSSVGVLDTNGASAGTVSASSVWGPPTSSPGSGPDPAQPVKVCSEAGFVVGELVPGEVSEVYGSVSPPETACSAVEI
jgi:hypothetical protein